MTAYEQIAHQELQRWKKKMQEKPSFLDRKTRQLQQKINSYIPDKVHNAITVAIKQMVKAVLFGSAHTSSERPPGVFSLEQTEHFVREKIRVYKNTAAAEGGLTGLGGILSGLADFPLFLSIKIKMLFEIASLYGFDLKDTRERVFILNIFQLAFSSQQHRREVFLTMQHWNTIDLNSNVEDFEWKKFQQEYRDHIDIAKLAQMLPGIGAVVGVIVNERLTRRLGKYAMNAYRMRILDKN